MEHENLNSQETAQLGIGAVTPSLQSTLKLAGKLALTARLVTTANAKNISKRIEDMEAALDAYDNEIISMLSKRQNNLITAHSFKNGR